MSARWPDLINAFAMHILLSNDDGYLAPGIICLAEVLGSIAEVTVVAPDRDRSGASNSLTLDRPIRADRMDNGFFRVEGTPTDCVHLAITGLLTQEPDMVIAGINSGANLGDDVLYSGTVAAAMEGRFLGLPAMAVSLASFTPRYFGTAAKVVTQLLRRLRDDPLPADTILNVNVPDLPEQRLLGFKATRLGYRHKAEPILESMDPRGRKLYWIGPPGPEQDAGPGTDFYAIKSNSVSVTPLQVDLTRHGSLEQVVGWLSEVEHP